METVFITEKYAVQGNIALLVIYNAVTKDWDSNIDMPVSVLSNLVNGMFVLFKQ